jgi:hypothetical protein
MRLNAVVITGLETLTASNAEMQIFNFSSDPGAANFNAWISRRKIDAAVYTL